MDYEVSAKDQEKIVEFSLLFNRRRALQNELEVLNKELNFVKDAQEEVLVNMDTPLLQVGECFMELPPDELENELDNKVSRLTERIEQAQSSLDSILAQSNSLKGELYSKFGNRINLD